MTLSELLRLREQVDIRADRLAKAKSNAYYTSPQWGNAGSGKTTEHSDRTAKAVEEKGLPRDMEGLSALCGVGPKVANCIGLFGLGKMDSFPIDVWVKRVMARMYDFREEDVQGMQSFAEAKFGALGGFAQQYLFYYIRELEE